jgi:hypothetical protein
MQETDLHYPPDACPFCGIASAYPFPSSQGLWSKKEEALGDAVPEEDECGVERTSPSSFLVMRSRDVIAFLDILPMTGGEFHSSSSFGDWERSKIGTVEGMLRKLSARWWVWAEWSRARRDWEGGETIAKHAKS